MSSYPPLKLSRLRDIGWKEWDPIGLLPTGEAWESYPEFADEYDRYLLHAASRLRRDWLVSDATDYLMWVVSEQMGLGSPSNSLARIRAETTAKAIKAYVDEPSGP
jgi:hypothetical protein